MFKSCNSSTCIETACTATSSPQVQLDLEVVFINSISMIEGPSPTEWTIEKGQIVSIITGNQSDGYSGTFPNDLTIDVNVEQNGRHNVIATAVVMESSGESRILNKTLVSKYMTYKVVVFEYIH